MQKNCDLLFSCRHLTLFNLYAFFSPLFMACKLYWRGKICFDSFLKQLKVSPVLQTALIPLIFPSTCILFWFIFLTVSIWLPRISYYMYFFYYLFFFTSGISLGGILPSAVCHWHLFYLQNSSHSISLAPILLSVSHTSPHLAYLHSREHPRKAEKIENPLVPVDETEAAPEYSLIFSCRFTSASLFIHSL